MLQVNRRASPGTLVIHHQSTNINYMNILPASRWQCLITDKRCQTSRRCRPHCLDRWSFLIHIRTVCHSYQSRFFLITLGRLQSGRYCPFSFVEKSLSLKHSCEISIIGNKLFAFGSRLARFRFCESGPNIVPYWLSRLSL